VQTVSYTIPTAASGGHVRFQSQARDSSVDPIDSANSYTNPKDVGFTDPLEITVPVASGNAYVGDTLTCSQPTATGGIAPYTYTYWWANADTNAVIFETSYLQQDLVLSDQDAMQSFYCQVTVTSADGQTAYQPSNSVGPVQYYTYGELTLLNNTTQQYVLNGAFEPLAYGTEYTYTGYNSGTLPSNLQNYVFSIRSGGSEIVSQDGTSCTIRTPGANPPTPSANNIQFISGNNKAHYTAYDNTSGYLYWWQPDQYTTTTTIKVQASDAGVFTFSDYAANGTASVQVLETTAGIVYSKDATDGGSYNSWTIEFPEGGGTLSYTIQQDSNGAYYVYTGEVSGLYMTWKGNPVYYNTQPTGQGASELFLYTPADLADKDPASSVISKMVFNSEGLGGGWYVYGIKVNGDWLYDSSLISGNITQAEIGNLTDGSTATYVNCTGGTQIEVDLSGYTSIQTVEVMDFGDYPTWPQYQSNGRGEWLGFNAAGEEILLPQSNTEGYTWYTRYTATPTFTSCAMNLTSTASTSDDPPSIVWTQQIT
tara:strand:- start:566 stop:2179 length:1614 start_codon:yes stop_codon:yes gene_type:complete